MSHRTKIARAMTSRRRAVCEPPSNGGSFQRRVCLDPWKRERERAPRSDDALAPDLSAVRLHDAARDRETESDAAVVVAPLPEVVEEVVDVRRRYSRPIIDHLNDYALAVRRRAESDCSVRWRELECISHDVADHL